MLADKDRIFTNLYGLHDAGLKGAMARGAWDGRGWRDTSWVHLGLEASRLALAERG